MPYIQGHAYSCRLSWQCDTLPAHRRDGLRVTRLTRTATCNARTCSWTCGSCCTAVSGVLKGRGHRAEHCLGGGAADGYISACLHAAVYSAARRLALAQASSVLAGDGYICAKPQQHPRTQQTKCGKVQRLGEPANGELRTACARGVQAVRVHPRGNRPQPVRALLRHLQRCDAACPPQLHAWRRKHCYPHRLHHALACAWAMHTAARGVALNARAKLLRTYEGCVQMPGSHGRPSGCQSRERTRCTL